MTVGELIGRLLWIDYQLPVVFRIVEPADSIAVEITAVEHLTYLPSDAIVAREPVCLIVGISNQH